MSQNKIKSAKGFYKAHLRLSKVLGGSFRNRTPLVTLGHKQFTIVDVVALALQSKTNMYFVGSTGSGKTLLAESILKSVFNNKGLYLRGDINLQLKDLLVKLNLQGKTEEEIYQLAEAMKYNFALIDELNRVPGVLQNQFLNIADGYVEIRGKKYSLGENNYMLMAATANPVSNGDYTGVFDEDLALLNRISLMINFDEIPLEVGDVFDIGLSHTNKDNIPLGDLSEEVLSSYLHLREEMKNSPETTFLGSLLKELIYNSFRYVSTNGKILDKTLVKGWRDELQGQHSAGFTMSYCSDIPVRTLLSMDRLAFSMFYIADAEANLMDEAGYGINGMIQLNISDLIQSYMNTLKLALSYNRKFIPEGLPEQLGKTHAEVLDQAFLDFQSSLDLDEFEKATLFLMEFSEALENNDEQIIQNSLSIASNSENHQSKNLFSPYKIACKIVESKERELRETEIRSAFNDVLED